LPGLVEKARFEKGYRRQLSGEMETGLAFDYSNGAVIVEAPKRILQAYSLIFPEKLLPVFRENQNTQIGKFLVPDYSFSDNNQKLKEYYEVSIKRSYPFHNMVPYLVKMPQRWSLANWKSIVDKLTSAVAQSTVENPATFLKDFIAKYNSLVSLEEITHILHPVVSEVNAPGLYMILQKKSVFSISMQELHVNLQNLQENIYPRLEASVAFAELILAQEMQWKSMNAESKKSSLEKLNLGLEKYKEIMKFTGSI